LCWSQKSLALTLHSEVMSKIVSVLLLIQILYFTSYQSNAQDFDEYETETIFGLNLNTNGGLIGGIMFRHTRALNKRGKYVNFGFEGVNVKHPNEVRYPNSYTGNVFVLGKMNYLIALRPHVGYEWKLFSKGIEDGVQVDFLLNAGPTIGLVKPYYIQYDNGKTIETVPYNPVLHDPATKGAGIVGAGGFLYGFDNLKIAPGLHLKSGLSFEFGTWGSGVSGIEAGAMFEIFPYKIDILEISSSTPTYNRNFFTSMYVNMYFGGRR